MAEPIIRSFEPSKQSVAPGESFSIRMDAYDPDSMLLVFEGTATDQQGNVARATTTVRVEDGLTGECSQPTGTTVVRDPTDPFLWHVRAGNG